MTDAENIRNGMHYVRVRQKETGRLDLVLIEPFRAWKT